MGLTIAIPTIGRPTLARTLFSFVEQLHDSDEVIIVADPKGDPDYASFVYELGTNRLGVNWVYAMHDGPGGWGQPQRNRAYELAGRSNHVWCLADDDVATPGALALLRAACHDRWSVFRVGRGNAAPWVWEDESVRTGNLDADCILAPTGVDAAWGLGYDGDAMFAGTLQAELGEPIWRTEVVAVTRPNADYLAEHYRLLTGGTPPETRDDGPLTETEMRSARGI